ncbi:hypothetical protein COO60DRAFT_830532 [Scenedesmus sp. NREL 46B-D3]|nr:hypothetical protein COO60DRAFT_830532 [Scenedesmus sp. NREL 46B-D3]
MHALQIKCYLLSACKMTASVMFLWDWLSDAVVCAFTADTGLPGMLAWCMCLSWPSAVTARSCLHAGYCGTAAAAPCLHAACAILSVLFCSCCSNRAVTELQSSCKVADQALWWFIW